MSATCHKRNQIISFLQDQNICYKTDYLIKYETYFKTGGIVKLFVAPQDYGKMVSLVSFLNVSRIKYRIIGYTSNMLFFDEIQYSVILSTKNLNSLEIKEKKIEVEAGYQLQDFVRVALINGWKGFDGLEGIPGSIGGALVMNAGAYGYSISDNLISVECIDGENRLSLLKKDDCLFEYRNSIFRGGGHCILRATFSLQKDSIARIAKNIEKFHIARHSYQEHAYPNLGSMISINENFYNEIFRNKKTFALLFWLLRILFKNPISKFLSRRNPNNIVFNWLLKKFLLLERRVLLNYQMSAKGANSLVNNGKVLPKEIIEYTLLCKELLGGKYHIENEFVVTPAFSVDPEFQGTYDLLVSKLSESRQDA
ncbi:MAG: FAD-binding protein [Anaerolineales bacterium]|nr:FAD-binding protein [Anaerolineales bacterium]MCW5855104.1 FAD-binding protein [Anaerolineales bacterium]